MTKTIGSSAPVSKEMLEKVSETVCESVVTTEWYAIENRSSLRASCRNRQTIKAKRGRVVWFYGRIQHNRESLCGEIALRQQCVTQLRRSQSNR